MPPGAGVVFDHSHGGGYDIGKRELVEGRTYMQPTSYAKALTDEGYVALCIDHWCFGERTTPTELDTFKAMLWQGRVLWGMMVYDSLRALDWLVTRGDVDGSRVAHARHVDGQLHGPVARGASTSASRSTVDICCLTEYHTLLAEKGLTGHGIYYYVPGLLKHFTASDINALIAPRAHLGLAGLRDALTPARGPRHHRPRAEGGLRRGRPPGALEAAPLRRRPPGDAGGPQEVLAFLKRELVTAPLHPRVPSRGLAHPRAPFVPLFLVPLPFPSSQS